MGMWSYRCDVSELTLFYNGALTQAWVEQRFFWRMFPKRSCLFWKNNCILTSQKTEKRWKTESRPSSASATPSLRAEWCGVAAGGWPPAVSEAGGLGLIGSGSMTPELLREHIRKCRAATSQPFGVNVPLPTAIRPS